MMEFESDEALAERLAAAAGQILIDLRATSGLEGKELGQQGDAQANELLMRELRAARPDDAILSEEEKDSITRCSFARCWVVDPLDGTREYGEGRTDWAVHVALAVEGVPTVGAVALPGLGITLSSANPWPLGAANVPPRMLVSRTRPAAEPMARSSAPSRSATKTASAAGAKAMAVVRGEADIYLHTGGQYEWDNCAPAAVAAAAGLHVSRADGSPLVYNCENPYLPDLLICRAEFADEVLRLAGEFAAAE